MMNPDTCRRLVSLDLFRGLAIAGMILVNNPGSGNRGARFAALVHAGWNGCTPADLIFPFFVFIIGLSTFMSLDKRTKAGRSLLPVYKYILQRTGLLLFLGMFGTFACGWLFQSICPPEQTRQGMGEIFLCSPAGTEIYFFSLDSLRIPGVLQRLALVYLMVSILLIHSRWFLQATVVAALLLLYWGLMTLTGFELLPGLDLSAYIDRTLWGEAHLYMPGWDPEGLLGTLPAIATGLAGALTGQWLRSNRQHRHKLIGIFLCGLLGVTVGKLWGLIFPLNKNLWTSSFAVYSTGWAWLFLGALSWLTDLKKARIGWCRPFLWLGHNPLLAYCGSQIGAMALNLLYLGTPEQHVNLQGIILNALFGVNWDVIDQGGWVDPRWPSLYWALLCLAFWTLLTGLYSHKYILSPTFLRTAVYRRIHSWDAKGVASGYLG